MKKINKLYLIKKLNTEIWGYLISKRILVNMPKKYEKNLSLILKKKLHKKRGNRNKLLINFNKTELNFLEMYNKKIKNLNNKFKANIPYETTKKNGVNSYLRKKIINKYKNLFFMKTKIRKKWARKRINNKSRRLIKKNNKLNVKYKISQILTYERFNLLIKRILRCRKMTNFHYFFNKYNLYKNKKSIFLKIKSINKKLKWKIYNLDKLSKSEKIKYQLCYLINPWQNLLKKYNSSLIKKRKPFLNYKDLKYFKESFLYKNGSSYNFLYRNLNKSRFRTSIIYCRYFCDTKINSIYINSDKIKLKVDKRNQKKNRDFSEIFFNNEKYKRYKSSVRSQNIKFSLKEKFLFFKSFYFLKSKKEIKNFLIIFLKKKRSNLRNYIFNLESRIITTLFRTNLFNSVYFIKQVVRSGCVYINSKIIKDEKYGLKVGDYFSIVLNSRDQKKKWLRSIIDNKKYINNIIINYPSYLTFNYRLLTGSYLRKPFALEMFNFYNLDYSFDTKF